MPNIQASQHQNTISMSSADDTITKSNTDDNNNNNSDKVVIVCSAEEQPDPSIDVITGVVYTAATSSNGHEHEHEHEHAAVEATTTNTIVVNEEKEKTTAEHINANINANINSNKNVGSITSSTAKRRTLSCSNDNSDGSAKIATNKRTKLSDTTCNVAKNNDHLVVANNDNEDEDEEESLSTAVAAAVAVTIAVAVEVNGEVAATTNEEKWQRRFQELLAYKEEHGNCLVPRTYAMNPQLGKWVKMQRFQYKKLSEGQRSRLTADRVRQLESIGFVWIVRSRKVAWDVRFEELCLYRQSTGNCLVPMRYANNPQLGRWVEVQRKEYKKFKQKQEQKTAMTEEHIQKLESIGFVWSLTCDWEDRFRELQGYRRTAGDCLVPRTYPPNQPLAYWVGHQRKEYNKFQRNQKSRLTQERISMLDGEDFCWDASKPGVPWDQRWLELLGYKEMHGDCLVPSDYLDNVDLAKWCRQQRKEYGKFQQGKKSRLTAVRIAMMEKEGFCWSVKQQQQQQQQLVTVHDDAMDSAVAACMDVNLNVNSVLEDVVVGTDDPDHQPALEGAEETLLAAVIVQGDNDGAGNDVDTDVHAQSHGGEEEKTSAASLERDEEEDATYEHGHEHGNIEVDEEQIQAAFKAVENEAVEI